MARYKVLKGVAHNVGHSFTSLMNYAGGDYVMGHILTFARECGQDTLTIDLATGEGKPSKLLQEPIAELPSWYSRKFWNMVQGSGSDRALVKEAKLTLAYELLRNRESRGTTHMASPYTCEVRIVDIRGKVYSAYFADWWYPEPPRSKRRGIRSWWSLLRSVFSRSIRDDLRIVP